MTKTWKPRTSRLDIVIRESSGHVLINLPNVSWRRNIDVTMRHSEEICGEEEDAEEEDSKWRQERMWGKKVENMSRESIHCRHRHHRFHPLHHHHRHHHHYHLRRRYDFVNHEKFRYLSITLRLRLPSLPSGETPRFRRSISCHRSFFPFLSVLAPPRYNDDDHD